MAIGDDCDCLRLFGFIDLLPHRPHLEETDRNSRGRGSQQRRRSLRTSRRYGRIDKNCFSKFK